jgi:threonine dehydrogenase-like Zn-dependent dehydrogenase
MKAVVWRGIGDIGLEDVSEPKVQDPMDAIVRITTSAICGTDLHFVHGSVPGMREGQILGHEAVGEVVDIGNNVRNFKAGDRVVVPSSISCGYCVYCRAGYQAQCDNANPGGIRAGTAYYGGPIAAGGFDGLQAEYARVPFASTSLVGVPAEVPDAEAIMLSDIMPTAWFAARLADVRPGATVAVFGCGPVGQLAIRSAQLQGADRVIAVDRVPDRLDAARRAHAETVNFDSDDPVAIIEELTGGTGVDRVIDAVGIDAQSPASARKRHDGGNAQEASFAPGDAPDQALQWAVRSVAKAGTIAVIGVYPPTMDSFPIGLVMNKNVSVNAGNCNHRRYIPELLSMTANGTLDPATVLTDQVPMTDVPNAYREFDRHEPGWLKVALKWRDGDGAS